MTRSATKRAAAVTPRSRAKDAAAEYVALAAPWATGWRVASGRPIARRRKHHVALLAVRRPDGTEATPFYVPDAKSEADALDRLRAAIVAETARLSAGRRPPEPTPRDGWDEVGDFFASLFSSLFSGAPPPPQQPRPVVRMGAATDADLRALGLRDWPNAEQLTAAWRETALRAHPDRAGGDAAKFTAARAAFERLRAVTDGAT